MRKQLLAALLALALLTAVLPAAGAASLSVFPDVTDPTLAEQVEFLRLMGVVNGKPGGGYDPSGTFTRAEFVKMAICALRKEDGVAAQSRRTIYQDVYPTFWANGYINLASVTTLGSGEDATPLVMGTGDGNFYPNRPITYGEAVAILCRMLGYSAADAAGGGAWYDGYLSLGRSSGLTDSLSVGGGAVITRAQAAALFYNLYFSKPKGSEKTYFVTLGGSEVDAGVVLSVNATHDDGTTGCFQTAADVYKTDRTFDAALVGQEGKLVLDPNGRLIAFRPKTGTTDKTVTTASAKSTQLTTIEGEKLTVEGDTLVYRNGTKTTWDGVYAQLAAYTPVTFHYAPSGALSYLFIAGEIGSKASVMVARTAPRSGENPFAALAGGGSFTLYKNGLPATAADLRQYDVATWDPATRTIQVSDVKLTGIFENASPSPADAAAVTVMGHAFKEVLPAAREDLSAFKIGSRITLLLTVDGKVAGAVSADVVRGAPVGFATVSGTTATVKLLENGLELSGTVSSGGYHGRLVTVNSSEKGKLNLSTVSGSAPLGDLNVTAGTLGDRTVCANVKVYDRVQDGPLTEVDYNTLPAAVPQSKIGLVGYDYAGRVRYLVLSDATGDAYTYGYFVLQEDVEAEPSVKRNYLGVRNAGSDGITDAAIFMGLAQNGAPGGMALTADGRAAATVELKPLTAVKSSAFDTDAMTVTVAGVAYPVSREVQVYNRSTSSWLTPGEDGLKTAVAYSDTLNLYYDRSPAEGGKIRMVVIP